MMIYTYYYVCMCARRPKRPTHACKQTKKKKKKNKSGREKQQDFGANTT